MKCGNSRLSLAARYAECIEACRSNLRAWAAATPWAGTLESYLAGGKYLRPLVALGAAESVGGRLDAALPAAEAVELLHAASLVHDDIIDSAGTRRGMPAAHVSLGRASALIAGDALLLRAFRVLADAPVGGDVLRRAIVEVHDHGVACCAGQLGELVLAPGSALTAGGYRMLAEAKTGRLFMAAGGLGAIFAGADEPSVAALRAFGGHLGVAYQIRDDVLDVLGDPVTVGKPVGNSAANGRPSLPAVLARSDSLGPSEAIARSLALGEEEVGLAVNALAGLPGKAGVELLRSIAEYSLVRPR